MSSRVDIYDVTMNSWSTTELSLARTEITGAATGNKVLFAGGVIGLSQYSSTVDIYDIVTNTWSTSSLPGGEAVGAAATVIGNNIYITGSASDWWAWDFGKITGPEGCLANPMILFLPL
jgi:DNA-binding beta-propeller fold protein YncE